MKLAEILLHLINNGFSVESDPTRKAGNYRATHKNGGVKLNIISIWCEVEEYHIGVIDTHKPYGKWILKPIPAPEYIKILTNCD